MDHEIDHRGPTDIPPEERSRRDFLRSAGKYAALTPPAVTLLLSTSMNSDAVAKSGGGGGRIKGNNGVGNGPDPQPPGNPPVNDGAGTGPGSPGNRGGAKKP